ncbi:ATP-binding protein [uncultured Bacteroides sp.]|uniref:ATP-binding protein n=1 Tax=uncultured Bacteroides sp. TaxID=162156 RepID=UPI00263386AA|nr:ATP-binding protein [uncultured Bacteroides sp.]
MLSTSSKISIGYITLIFILLGSFVYVYHQMDLLTDPEGIEENINNKKKTTYQIFNHLYKAEIIGQTLRSGRLDDYPEYIEAMQNAHAYIDSLQNLLNDTLQKARLDTVRILLQSKEENMMAVLEAMRDVPTNKLYQQQVDSLIAQQTTLLNNTHLRQRVVTHQDVYTIHHRPKKFFKRLADVFSPDEEDSTQVNKITQEVYTDTINEAYNPVDTIANMLSNLQRKVLRSQEAQQERLNTQLNELRVAGSILSQRVNEILESIEIDERKAYENKAKQEHEIRERAYWTIATIATLAIILVFIFSSITWKDIERRNKYRKELEKAKSYAENLLIAREKLMLTITHDIKAPAGSILGYIDLLLRLIKDKRELFYLQNMKSSANHLLDLITSLLDYHRLEANKMDLQSVSFCPSQLFKCIYNSYLPLTSKKGLTLKYIENIDSSLNLIGDPFRIRQIAENLLSNALKFTSEGGIVLTTNYTDGEFTLSVKDTGCGMTPQEQEKIFKEFTRLRSAQGQEGFGLGLSITKKLIELQKGHLQVESTPMKGSTFNVSIPLKESNDEAQPEIHTNQVITKKDIHILLIDDDRIQLSLTEAMLLNTFGITAAPVIYTCEQPEELFKQITEGHYDIVFTDIQMPTMNGFDLLRTLRALPTEQAKTIPVIAITARSDMNEKDFKDFGFNGCLYKPFNQADLARIINKNLKIDIATPIEPVKLASNSCTEIEYKYNFSPLIAFSEDDPEAAKAIINTFIKETERHMQNIQKALEREDMKTLCEIAHKMLPISIMIEAKEGIPALEWLELHRNEKVLNEEAKEKARNILDCATKVIQEATIFYTKH